MAIGIEKKKKNGDEQILFEIKVTTLLNMRKKSTQNKNRNILNNKN